MSGNDGAGPAAPLRPTIHPIIIKIFLDSILA